MSFYRENAVIRRKAARPFRRLAVVFGLILMILAIVICVWIVQSHNSGENETVSMPESVTLEIPYEPSAHQLAVKNSFEEAYIDHGDFCEFEQLIMDEIDGSLSTANLFLYDVTHSKILYSRNADALCYPASTTKIMTACVAAQFCEPNTEFTVGDELSLVAWDSSVAGLARGEKLTFEMLLDALMLPSGNDAAYVMAAGVGRIYAGDPNLGYEEAVAIFCDLMNNTAARLGCTGSHFSCPDGYHDSENYVTAADMMKIALYASSFDMVKASYGKYEAEHVILTGEEYYWENSNPLINPYSSSYYPYATGLKTGFTDEAGSCLVASAEKNGVEIIAVALGSSSISVRNQDLVTMMEAAFCCCDRLES